MSLDKSSTTASRPDDLSVYEKTVGSSDINNNDLPTSNHTNPVEKDTQSNSVHHVIPFFSRSHWLGPVSRDHGDLPLLACSFVTGMVDAASFRNWGMFIGMQTGNTVILGLSASGLPENPWAWLTTLVSLASFLVGAWITYRVSSWLVPDGPTTNRLWASALFGIQGVLIIVAAALASVPGLVPQNPGGTARDDRDPGDVIRNVKIVALIPLLAFQGGMQIAVSRLLGYSEIPVNVLTSTYADLMGDFKLLAPHNVKRNRRVTAVVLLIAGAIASGFLLRSQGGLMSVLWVAGFIKILTGIAMFAFLPAAIAS